MSWIEATGIGFVAVGGTLAVVLAVAPRLARRLYAEAVVSGRDRAAGFWAFLELGADRL